MLFIIGLILLVIILLKENSDLKKQIVNYKNKLLNTTPCNYCPKCGYELVKNNKDPVQKEIINETINKPEPIKEQKVIKKKTMTEKEIKNNSILITGSILIILAAVIFLTTSWSILNNPIKCLIIFSLLIVFIIVSYLAKNKYNLINTARAFKYIYLSYLLLSLISLSIFNLIGSEFSLYGKFQDIYFSIVFIISSIIYFIEGKNDKDKVLFVASIITAILGIIILTNTISNNNQVVLIGLYLYSVFLALLYKNKIYLYNESFTKKVIQILSIILLIFSLLPTLFIIIFAYQSINYIYSIILLLLVSINILLSLNNKVIIGTLLEIILLMIFTSISRICNLNIMNIQISLLIGIILINIINYSKDKKLNIYTFIVSSVTILLLSLLTMVLKIYKIEVLPLYIITLIYSIILFIYLNNDKLKDIIIILITLFIQIDTLLLVLRFNLNNSFLLLISLLLLLIPFIKKYEKNKDSIILMTSIISYIFIMIDYNSKSILSVLLIVCLCIVMYYYSSKYKYLLYIFINLFYLYLGNILIKGIIPHLLSLSTITVISLEYINEDFKDNNNFIFIIISIILSSISLLYLNAKTALMMTIILSLILYVYMKDNKQDIKLLSIPLLLPLPYMIISDIFVYNNINYMLLFIIIYIIISIVPIIYNKKYIKLSIIPYIYTLSIYIISISTIFEDKSFYLIGLLSFIISIIYYIYTDKKILFKLLAILSTLIIYYQFIINNNINYTIFRLGILLIYLLYIIRNVIKDKCNYKQIEYIFNIIINLLAITSFISEIDGLLYVTLLVILVIYSYIKKYGPTFIISLIFIVINTLLLTRTFWLSLPWWLYILLLGIILVVFAIRNEMKEKGKVKNKLKNIKDKLDI